MHCLMALALVSSFPHAALLSMLLLLTFSVTQAKACGDPEKVPNAEVIERPTDDRYVRYKCLEGYKREAGTSNLAVCKYNNATRQSRWEFINISCIRDPSIPMTTPRISPSTKSGDPSIPMTTPRTSPSTISGDPSFPMTTPRTSPSTISGGPSIPMTTPRTSPTTISGDPSTPMTAPSTSPSTISGSSSSPDFTSPSTEWPTTELQTSTSGITVPGTTSTADTPALHYSTLGHMTYSPGPSSSNGPTASTKGSLTTATTKTTMPETSKKAVTVPGHPEATTTESYHSTLDQTTFPPEANSSIWAQAKTVGSVTSPLLLLLIATIGIVVYKRRRIRKHFSVPQEEPESHSAGLNEQVEITEL